MPGLTHQDLELMMSGIAAPGNAALAVREEQRRKRQLDIEEAMRQKMLEQEVRQTAAAEGRNTLLDKRAEAQDKNQMLQNVFKLNAAGQLSDLDSVNKWLSEDPHISPLGLKLVKPPQKLPPQAGQSAIAQALAKASEWRQAGNDKYADMLEKWASKQTEPTTQYEEITEETPAQEATPAEPATSGFLGSGIGAKPGVPASPGQPKRTVKRKVPLGTAPPAAAPATAPNGKPITDKQGKKWLYKGTMADPTQDRNPANWVPQ